MYIKIPVYWDEDDDEFGTKSNSDAVEMCINTNHICAHGESDGGSTLICMSNGMEYRSPILHKSFETLIDEISIAIDLKVTDN
jgi:hypothetical protein